MPARPRELTCVLACCLLLAACDRSAATSDAGETPAEAAATKAEAPPEPAPAVLSLGPAKLWREGHEDRAFVLSPDGAITLAGAAFGTVDANGELRDAAGTLMMRATAEGAVVSEGGESTGVVLDDGGGKLSLERLAIDVRFGADGKVAIDATGPNSVLLGSGSPQMLSAAVAHEINNPLTYVLANLHILSKRAEKAIGFEDRERARDSLCSEDTLELLRETADGARRVRDIARDLKTFSRSSEEVQPVDVRQVLDSSVRMAINEIRHRAKLERNYMDVPLCLANSSRLGQVFLNLIVNAAQAIPEGAADENLISLVTTTSADGWVEVSVTDTGSGIPQQLIERIFEPFVTMKPVGIGTGLGLYICRDIIHHLGGVIEVESEPGKGTTFKVRLPPAPAGAEVGGKKPRGASKREQVVPRAKLLVIDDETNIGRSFSRSFPEHDVTVVDSGREGIRLLDEGQQFELIFCDIMMPDLTGRDVYEHIVEHHPAMAKRIVFMTGGAFTERAAEFIERVEARRIDKPFDIAVIRTVMREELEKHRAAAATTPNN